MRISHLLGLLSVVSGTLAATFKSCTAAQIVTLEAAIERATNKSFAAIEHLEDNPNGSDVQTTWYGTFSTDRYNRVLTAFKVRLGGASQSHRKKERNAMGLRVDVVENRNSRLIWPRRFHTIARVPAPLSTRLLAGRTATSEFVVCISMRRCFRLLDGIGISGSEFMS